MAETQEKKPQVAKGSKAIRKTPRKTGAPVRLWVKSVFLGFRRSKVQQNENQALLKIQGVNDRKYASFYFGKRVAYIYKAHTTQNNTKYRAIFGKISRAHGDNGVVIARFNTNLPPKAMGGIVRVFLYPHRFQGQFRLAGQ